MDPTIERFVRESCHTAPDARCKLRQFVVRFRTDNRPPRGEVLAPMANPPRGRAGISHRRRVAWRGVHLRTEFRAGTAVGRRERQGPARAGMSDAYASLAGAHRIGRRAGSWWLTPDRPPSPATFAEVHDAA